MHSAGHRVSVASPRYADKLVGALSQPGLPNVISTSWISDQLDVPWRTVSHRLLGRSAVKVALGLLGWTYRPASGRRGSSFIRVNVDCTPEAERSLGLPWATISKVLLWYETAPL
jgi:hypothetical protein